jgi:hypothetical protein
MFPARYYSTTGTAMSAPLIISTLRDKRLEVADAIERLERPTNGVHFTWRIMSIGLRNWAHGF